MSEMARQAIAKEVISDDFKALVDRIEEKILAGAEPFQEPVSLRPVVRRIRQNDADWERTLDEIWA